MKEHPSDQLPPIRVSLRAPATDRAWRALWDWLLAPTVQEKAAQVAELGENYAPGDDDPNDEEAGNTQ